MKILVDSLSDIQLFEAEKLGVEVIPLTVSFGEDEYLDGVNLDLNDFYDMLVNKHLYPKTSQPSPQLYIDKFKEAKDKNEDLIYLAVSSKISGTIKSAEMAKQIVDYDRIYIIDTLTLSGGIQLILTELLRKNSELDTISLVNHLNEFKTRVGVLCGLDTLEYVYKGGRVSKSQFVLGDIIKLKPVLTVVDGVITPFSKAIGLLRSCDIIKKTFIKEEPDLSFEPLFGYTMHPDNMNYLIKKLKVGEKVIHVGTAIGTHVGPDAYAVFYIRK